MIGTGDKIAIFLEGHVGDSHGKLGYGVLRYAPYAVVCVVDSQTAGRDVRGVLGIDRDCPIVADVEAARSVGANVLVLGLTPSGGQIPTAWMRPIERAVELGLSIVNGLHQPLAPHWQSNLATEQWIWDVRQEPETLDIAQGRGGDRCPKRVLMVGTDMAVGKMTAALELHRAAVERGCRAGFLATGQTGIIISGQGVPLDAVRVDFASGAIEAEMWKHKHQEIVFIEGQGALNHPASTSTLPLMRGSEPTDIILCHRARQTHLEGRPKFAIPGLAELALLYQDVASCCGTFARPRWAGVSLNTGALSERDARDAIETTATQTGRPTTDPVRSSGAPLLDALGI